MDVKKALNFASWVIFAFGVFFTFSMAVIAMVLQGIFYYFKKDNKKDIDNTP
tara:strand:- start:118 stop:273 length:156 start_codon:yes stop_codon:yes gene_type:complete